MQRLQETTRTLSFDWRWNNLDRHHAYPVYKLQCYHCTNPLQFVRSTIPKRSLICIQNVPLRNGQISGARSLGHLEPKMSNKLQFVSTFLPSEPAHLFNLMELLLLRTLSWLMAVWQCSVGRTVGESKPLPNIFTNEEYVYMYFVYGFCTRSALRQQSLLVIGRHTECWEVTGIISL